SNSDIRTAKKPLTSLHLQQSSNASPFLNVAAQKFYQKGQKSYHQKSLFYLHLFCLKSKRVPDFEKAQNQFFHLKKGQNFLTSMFVSSPYPLFSVSVACSNAWSSQYFCRFVRSSPVISAKKVCSICWGEFLRSFSFSS